MSTSDRRLVRIALAVAMGSLLESWAGWSPAAVMNYENSPPSRGRGSLAPGMRAGRPGGGARPVRRYLGVLQLLYPSPPGEVNRGTVSGGRAHSFLHPAPSIKPTSAGR